MGLSVVLIGGILTDSGASWRAIYWLQAGLGCLLCGLGWYVLPEDEVSKRYDKGLDIIGAILSTCGLGLLVYDLGCGILFLSYRRYHKAQHDFTTSVNQPQLLEVGPHRSYPPYSAPPSSS